MHSLEAVRAYATALPRPFTLPGGQLGGHGKGRDPFRGQRVHPAERRHRAGHTRGDQEPQQLPRHGTRRGFRDPAPDRLANKGQPVVQETLGWDDAKGATFTQRSKEDATIPLLPEPDLPPL